MSDPSAEGQQTHKRICDFCSESVAILLCRADSANLCLSCDREVHSTNQLFTKHTRWQICDSCDSTPATILCSTENTVLCQNCDWETHNHSSLHERRPIEGFSGCPSVSELSTLIMGFDDGISKKELFMEDEEEGHGFISVESDQEFSVWETPPITSLDDLMMVNKSAHNFQAMGVPPLPKNRKTACGKYKDEMLRQLRKMAESESDSIDWSSWDHEQLYDKLFADQDPNLDELHADQDPNLNELHADQDPNLDELLADPNLNELFADPNLNELLADQDPNPDEPPSMIINPQEAIADGWSCSQKFENQDVTNLLPNIYSDVNQISSNNAIEVFPNIYPDINPISSNYPTDVIPDSFGAKAYTPWEREHVLSKYKNKKNMRRYDKRVRYETRKAIADARLRVKGRFVKTGQ